MECCGKIVTTPFCPMCGKARTHEGPLYDILDHIRAEIGKNRRRLHAIENGTARSVYPGTKEKLTTKWLPKWEAWEAAISEAIEVREKTSAPK
jgi:hypothetical protein